MFLTFLLRGLLFAMVELEVPTTETVHLITQHASLALSDRMYFCTTDSILKPKICCVCDAMHTVDNTCIRVELCRFIDLCEKSKASKDEISWFYPDELLVQYSSSDSRLSNFVLSPSTNVMKSEDGSEGVLVCQGCMLTFDSNNPRRKKTFVSPPKALWNGFLIGEPPQVIKDLRTAELALVSPNRILTHAITLHCDHHDGIYGWHSMYENRVGQNISDLSYLVESGMSGEIVCVLCGPFTKTQHALARKQMHVRPDAVIAAFTWLKANNHYFRDDPNFEIPDETSVKQPIIITDESL